MLSVKKSLIGWSRALIPLALLTACQTPQQAIVQHEDRLAAAGFLIRPANSPERQNMLHRLPPNQFVQRVHGDNVHYVYADPVVCNCLYVGSQAAYGQYQRDRQQQQLADQQQAFAQIYSDAAWNWGAWGPWGAGFGFQYGPDVGW